MYSEPSHRATTFPLNEATRLNRRLRPFEACIATSPQQFGVSHMALSAAEQQFIIDKEREWIDLSFGSIDLSAFSDPQARPPAESHDDSRSRPDADR
jgi:hypothetical protein